MNDSVVSGNIFDIQHFCISDGPGIRTIVFFKGCALRCKWCHNPESYQTEPQIMLYSQMCVGCGRCAAVCSQGCHRISAGEHRYDRKNCLNCGKCADHCYTNALRLAGKRMSVRSVMTEIMEDRVFYENSGGGITLSGGEPLIQPDFALALLQAAKARRLHTCVETCGCFDPAIVSRVIPLCDLILWDIKDTCPQRHRQYTGVSNERIISNLVAADSLGAKTRIRCIMVNGVNTDKQHYKKLADLIGRLKHCEGMELLPYHTYGDSKSLALFNKHSRIDRWIPTREQVEDAAQYLRKEGIPVLNRS